MFSRKTLIGAVAVAAFVIAMPFTAEAQDPPMPTTTDTLAPVTTPPAEPDLVVPPEPPPEVTPAPSIVPPPPPAEPMVTPPPAAPITSPAVIAAVTVPPQEKGPLTMGNFNAAVANQADHLARFRRLRNISADQLTIINTANLSPSAETAGIEQAMTRAEARGESVRAAIRANEVVSGALSTAGISIDNVVALAVRGHELNDITIYHR